jgi:hypothetical protein
MLIAACNDHKKIANDIEDYRERLQSYTQIELETTPLELDLQAPNKQSLKIDIPRLSINLREFYAFNNCSLNQLVAQRNTALGKMQLPSSRYAYESELIIELSACLKSLSSADGQTQLIERLEQWIDVKDEQLPIAWTNLLTQSSETYKHLIASSGFISGNSDDNFQATKQALAFLLRSKDDHPVDITELELHLKQLDKTALIARLWRTQLLVTQELNNISLLLSTFLTNNSCSTLQDKESIDVMRNIFRIFFAERIQPVASQLNKYHYQLSPIINEIAGVTNLPTAFSNYLLNHTGTNNEAYTQAMSEHISLWQQIFTRCD